MPLGLRATQSESVVARAGERFGDAPALRLLRARVQVERGEWLEAEALLAPLAGSSDATLVCAAWAWIAVARIGRRDLDGASEAARAALSVDRDDAVAAWVEKFIHTARPMDPPAGGDRRAGLMAP